MWLPFNNNWSPVGVIGFPPVSNNKLKQIFFNQTEITFNKIHYLVSFPRQIAIWSEWIVPAGVGTARTQAKGFC